MTSELQLEAGPGLPSRAWKLDFKKRQVDQLRARVKTAEREGRMEEALRMDGGIEPTGARKMRGAGERLNVTDVASPVLYTECNWYVAPHDGTGI